MTSKGLKRTCTFLARWAILASLSIALKMPLPIAQNTIQYLPDMLQPPFLGNHSRTGEEEG